MLFIAFSLLSGWILSWFGFQAVVVAGMAQVFGVTITTLGYYFLFAMFGASKQVATILRGGTRNFNFGELKNNLKKAKEESKERTDLNKKG